MLSKKTTSEKGGAKIGILRNKKKIETTSTFSGFEDDIRVQAYYNYLKRMKDGVPGSEMSDWLDAEISIRSKMSTH